MPERIGFVVVAGHMDIEWYQPMRSYRFWTVDALEQLKDIAAHRPDFRNYVLDGQVFPLEAYLDVIPGDRQAMMDLVASRMLSIGPFYTQFDEWLPSAEAMIRNCLYGNRLSSGYGRCMKAGYLPDNFGHPLQMPQILNGFGIGSLLFMRGMPEMEGDHPDEFILEGPDGSRVLASHFRESYCGAFDLFNKDIDPIQPRDVPYYQGYLSYEWHLELADHDDPERIARNLVVNARRIGERYPSGIIPLIAGFDHLPPQVNIGDSLKIANEIQSDIRFVIGDVEDYVNLVMARLNLPADLREVSRNHPAEPGETSRNHPAAPREESMHLPLILREELLGSVYQFILLGALSTRTYLKQKQFSAEMLMEKYVEPLTALAACHGYAGKPALIHEAWRNIMINSAHDSIHGSSTDEVHVEMEARYAAVHQIAAGVIHDMMKYAGRHVRHWWGRQAKGVVAFAPAASPLPQMAEVWLPIGDRTGFLVDVNGTQMPTQVLPRDPIEVNGAGKPRNGACPADIYRKVLFSDRFESQQIKTYAWQDGEAGIPPAACSYGECRMTAQASDGAIENSFLRVEASGALIHILDKRTGRKYCNLNLLEEEADAGDAWDYSPPWIPGEAVRSTRFTFNSCLMEDGPVRQSLRLTGSMSVPLCLHGDARSEDRAQMPVVFTISLTCGIPRVDVLLDIDNQGMDHRLRLRLPGNVKTAEVLSQGHLAIITRPATPPEPKKAWRQPPTRLFPFREWLAVQDGQEGLAIAVKGLYDYEAVMNPLTGMPDICITLLRGIGRMSRENMMQRTERASDSFCTPGAQCLGLQSFEWSCIPYSVDKDDLAPFRHVADTFFCPPVVHAIRSDCADERLTDFSRLLRGLPGHVCLSAIKKSHDDDGIILRFYENQGKSGQTKIDISGFNGVMRSDMNESAGEPLDVVEGHAAIEIKPYEAVTLKLSR
jgi:mannosylglycerate hydrolase